MEVLIRTLTGKNLTLSLQPDDKTSDLLNKLSEKEGIAPSQMTLLSAGRNICDCEIGWAETPIHDLDQPVTHGLQLRSDSEGNLYQQTERAFGGTSLAQLDISDGTTLYLICEFRGGMFHVSSGRRNFELLHGPQVRVRITLPSGDTTTVIHNQPLTFRRLALNLLKLQALDA